MVRKGKADDVVFEGVVIPGGTRSAKLAKKGIADTDEMADFLTAVFSDTLKGKIILPTRKSRIRVSSKSLDGSELKLTRGLPVTIQVMSSKGKGPRKSKTKSPEKT